LNSTAICGLKLLSNFFRLYRQMSRSFSGLFFLLIVLLSCKQQELPHQAESASTKPKRYLALGDSYSIGESVSAKENFPNQLSETLDEKQSVRVMETQIIAQTGWRTDNLINAIDQLGPDSNFQLVSLLIGVNNFYQHRPISQYELEFEILVQRAIAHAESEPKQVIVVSIPDFGYSPFGQSRDPEKISEQTDMYNGLAQQICQQYGVKFISITDLSRSLNSKLIASDGLHPSAYQYGLWVKRIAEAIQ